MRTRVLMVLAISLADVNVACCQTPAQAYVVSGIDVQLTDAVTNQPITTATVTLTNGDYQEQALPFFGAYEQTHYGTPGVYEGAYDRPGTYTVTIVAPGYEPKVFEGIVVKRGKPCHVQTTQLEIQLQPAS